MKLLINRPRSTAVVVTVLTLASGAAAFHLAHFGASVWVFAPLFLLLATIGLPTTLAVLLTASLWGRVWFLNGLVPFFVCATVLALAFQIAAFMLLRRIMLSQPHGW